MEPRFPRTALRVTAGLLIWAADFLFIYVFAALACARGHAHATALGFAIVPLASILATAVAALATAGLIAAGRRGTAVPATGSRDETPWEFLGRLTTIVAVLALLAVALTGLPGLLVAQTCQI